MNPQEINQQNYRQRCNALLTVMLGVKLVDNWWNSPNKAFALLTPNQQWEIDYMSVYSYLMQCADGGW